jgi:peroxiredoxin Q/BCP
MIDPPKATKGRRMSKETRKKSSKAPSRKAPPAPSMRSAGKQSSKTRPAKAATAASTKASSKKLKPTSAKESAPLGRLTSKTTAAKAATVKQTARKLPGATGKAATSVARSSVLTEGTKAPAFHLPRDGSGTVSLSDYAGKKLVLFFYPRANTPGCTKEAIDFTRLSGAFAQNQTAILGVSADSPKAQQAFRDKHQLSIPLVSDEKHQMLEAYGVWGEKSMYGKTFQGVFRTTVLIGKDGRIVRIWRNVKVDGHADDVLAAARSL